MAISSSTAAYKYWRASSVRASDTCVRKMPRQVSLARNSSVTRRRSGRPSKYECPLFPAFGKMPPWRSRWVRRLLGSCYVATPSKGGVCVASKRLPAVQWLDDPFSSSIDLSRETKRSNSSLSAKSIAASNPLSNASSLETKLKATDALHTALALSRACSTILASNVSCSSVSRLAMNRVLARA